MAISRKEIEDELQRAWMGNEGVAELFGFEVGTSFDAVYARVSVVRLLFWVVSYVAAAREQLYDDWKEEVRAVAETTHYGTEPWWLEAVKAWQEGDELEEIGGRMAYRVVDESKRVVTAVSVGVAWRELNIKVAKGEAGALEALSAEQCAMLQGYCNKVRPLGVKVRVKSGEANVVGLGGRVRYAAERNPRDVKQSVKEAVAAMLTDLRFGGTLYEGRLEAAIMGVDGVEDVQLGGLTLDGAAWSDSVVPGSGYCVPGDDGMEYIAV